MSEKCQEMTLESLIKRGPEGNPHVAIKDFTLGENGVKLIDENKPDHFKTIWLPAVPRDPAQPPGFPAAVKGELTAILKSNSVPDQATLDRLFKETRLTGMVINKIDNLGSEQRRLLQQSYPGTDFDRCIILEHNRTPHTAEFRTWLLGGGVLALVVGCLLFVSGYLKHRPAYI